ncbi:MAG: helix-turn-helix domain-containing protein [Holosporaceae bacterium]|jgi:transcriptional regulator with XRE-family HTH domain|nr:helix-turn-helix domain-containing protein [Holosporaceae bacterium]
MVFVVGIRMSLDYNVDKIKKVSKNLDSFIGNKIKFRRSMLSISQDKLGSYLGVTFQQIQKYEKGTNRVSASMLYRIANFLDVNVSFFTDGFDNPSKTLNDENQLGYNIDIGKKKESIDLLKAYYKIKDSSVRKKILELIKTFSATVV